MENATTKGHSAAQGGLRGHSVGDAYPEIVIGLGDGFAKYNVLTGETGPVRKTYDEALFWKELDQPCPAACARTRTAEVCPTCTWFTAENLGRVRAAALPAKRFAETTPRAVSMCLGHGLPYGADTRFKLLLAGAAHSQCADPGEVTIPSVLVSGDEWDATPGNYIAERVGK